MSHTASAHHGTRPRGSARSSVRLQHELAGLPALDTRALRQQWRRRWGAEPAPGLSRWLLLRAVAYRLQADALGGLKPATERRLHAVAADAAAPRPARPARPLPPGTVLVREWHGTSHRVTRVDHGWAWRERRYRSLSEIARAITGTRWSGPRFFGLATARRHGTR